MTSTLIAYRTPPQMERKAAQEAREAGHKAYLPTETRQTKIGARRVPTAPGYVFCEGRPAEARYIRGAVGPLPDRMSLRPLYVRTSKTQRRHAFAPGDAVSVKRGRDADLAATVVEVIRSGWYLVRVAMFGKSHDIKIRESDLARMHPGS